MASDERLARVTPLADAMQRMAAQLADRDPSRQWSLFDDQPLPDDDRPGAPGPDDDRPGAPGRRGRPPGARNRSTEQFRAFVRSTRGDPGLALLDRVFADPKALARALGAPTAWDVYKAQSDWLLRLLPYFWSAMPAELKIATRGALAVGISGTPGAFPGGDQITSADPFQTLLALATGQPIPAADLEPAANDQAALPSPDQA